MTYTIVFCDNNLIKAIYVKTGIKLAGKSHRNIDIMKKKILILDDDKDILDILAYMLSEEGYEIHTQMHGENIMPTLKSLSPDLILIDLMLAGLDGRSISRAIKQNPETRHIPVIMITARPDLRPQPHEEDAPDDFISKPFDINNVIKKVAKYLKS
jgi:CheY-like chemotaxis protein